MTSQHGEEIAKQAQNSQEQEILEAFLEESKEIVV